MSRATRAFWLFMAGLFFVSTVGFTGYIIYSIKQNNERSKQAEAQQKALQDQQAADDQPKEGDLKGTKMAGFTPVEGVNQLQKIDLNEGTGEAVPADPSTSVTVHYIGALAKDGTIFDTSYDRGQPATFALNGVIPGWTEGIPGMKVGGKRRLLIPAALAYGPQERPGIPANSDLVFDVELVKIGQ